MIELLRHVDRTGGTWMRQAACQGLDVSLFFPNREDGELVRYPAAAKRACKQCLVRTECANYAITHGIKDGMWGGLAPNQRRGRRYSNQRASEVARGERVYTAPLAAHWKTMKERPIVADLGYLCGTNTDLNRMLNGKVATMDIRLAYRVARALGARPTDLWPDR